MPKFKPYPGEIPREALERISENIENEGLPTSDASFRTETYQLGGAVRPPTSPSMMPASPASQGVTPQYKPGGKVRGNVKGEKADITDIVKRTEKAQKVGTPRKKQKQLKKAKRLAREVIEQSEYPGEDWGRKKKK